MSSAHLKKFATVKPAKIEWRNNQPFNLEFDDIYFSSEGGVDESNYVFIEGNQLEKDWSNKQQSDFSIIELGFGSGLNFFNTVTLWQQITKQNAYNKNNHLHYLSIEKRPLTVSDLKLITHHWPQFSKLSTKLIRNYPSLTYGRHQIFLKEYQVTLTLFFMPVDDALQDLVTESNYQADKLKIDHWFLDGFAPSKNTEMWAPSTCEKIAHLSKPGTRLASFSVASQVKTPLKEVGFKIIKRKGFGRKREMLTATFAPPQTNSPTAKFINLKYERPWLHYKQTTKPKQVAIIGGGIAGCATAYCLAQKGIAVDIFEHSKHLASQASGAAAGIFHPQLTSDMNYSSQFSWLGYLYLLRFLAELPKVEKDAVIIQSGLIRLLDSATQKDELLNLIDELRLHNWVSHVPAHINPERSLLFPHAAALNMSKLCKLFINQIDTSQKRLLLNTSVTAVNQQDNQWEVITNQQKLVYQHVIFCGGAKSQLHNQFINFSTNVTRGQTCAFSHPLLGEQLKQILCEQIYLVPHENHAFILGATFDELHDDKLNYHSQKNLLDKATNLLQTMQLPFLSDSQKQALELQGTIGYRLHSQDRLPIVGGVTDKTKLTHDFTGLGQKRLLRDKLSYYNIPGLWLNTAYGSHGLINSLLASQHLASLINNDISPIPQTLAEAIHPARFIIKKLK
ncbi:bifunctional tRNA (5-methylaminomethyl-2-thiouridine)(34)-methyltransferase MnmD/FAD-dependent 5-carboxymethylaminomethyl-2-thiouridine(34) oxidoreductase MnmC [Aliikangiella sp. IMCC44359]|uniref:bifunctional tRNA (5-methylaminomethyl-2-thiouridine)(34)-methyltransferase MnmD/FAD-dependent 5-carboxymethylaminomethyl-2-thiouridine(34) oxidoreductase MnmC n=1 Tax=Aliikangiella sp. IMCC44359 TaxID=3459125 RepID=UPI00403B381E